MKRAVVHGFECDCRSTETGVELVLSWKGRARLAAAEGDRLEVTSDGLTWIGIQRGPAIEIEGATLGDFADSVHIRRAS